MVVTDNGAMEPQLRLHWEIGTGHCREVVITDNGAMEPQLRLHWDIGTGVVTDNGALDPPN